MGRLRDKYRKFKSGGEKRKLKIAKEHQNERQKNSLLKFFKKDQNDTMKKKFNLVAIVMNMTICN